MQIVDRKKQPLREWIFKSSLGHSFAVFGGFSLFYILFFFSALFSQKLLAPGDGINYFLPALYTKNSLWTNLIFAGYPITADPQNMTWYPPAFLLGLIPGSWNAFILLAYILAGSFAYCYTYIVTKSKLAAIVTGLVYSMSGFMIGHLGHAAMIHAAAWIPLIVCSLEKLRHHFIRFWFLVGVLAVACCFLGGHPQISAYGIGIGFLYALFLGWRAPVGRWKYYRWSLGVLAIGVALCSLQLLPTAELSRLSLRAEMPYRIFIGGSLPLWQTLQMLFPFLFGGWISKFPYSLPYWGDGGITEMTGYVGLLPLMLAVIGTVAYRNRPIVIFWFWTGLIAFLFVCGEDLLIGRLLYYVPVYNSFRIQPRHFVEVAFAVSVLAGLGVASIQNKWASRRLTLKAILASALIMLGGLLSIVVLSQFFRSKLSQAGLTKISFLPWENSAVGIPLLIFGLGVVSLISLSRWKESRWSMLAILTVVLLDLSSFGFWLYDWNSPLMAPAVSRLTPDPSLEVYRDALQKKHQRFLSSQGIYNVWEQSSVIANLTRLWDLPNVSGYSPLTPSRFSQMVQIDETATLRYFPLTSQEHQLDLMSVQYLLASPTGMIPQEGLKWADTDLNIILGSGACVPTTGATNHTLDLFNNSYQATSIAVASFLGCSVEIPNNSELVEVRIVDADGTVETHSLLAGRDTSEQAYDCPDVHPFMQHQRAKVFKSIPTTRPNGEVCQAHSYVSNIQLNRPQQIRRIEFNWKNLPALINVNHVSLINGSEATSLPITLLGMSPKWKKVEILESGIIYENQDVLPRTWLVPETMILKPEEILAAVHTSQLPDGSTFDPKAMALVESSTAALKSNALQPTDYANVIDITETQVELAAQVTAPAFLVLSDVFYPGWKATIDGQSTHIFQTNYIQRGVKLPPGKHIVRFEFYPLSFRVGLGISMASCFACMYVLLRRV